MRDELYPEMFHMEQSHWWFQGKHTIVQSLLERFLLDRTDGSDAARGKFAIADLGCGCGGMLECLKDQYEVTGLDGADQAIAFSAQRGVRVHKGFLPDDVPLPRENFDAVLMLDVLEHLEKDAESARVAVSLLRPGGILVCTVPAGQWLWTRRDEYHQHFRRYSARGFRTLFDQPGLRVELFSHLNTWLFPLAAATRLMEKFRNTHDTTDLHIPARPINAALRMVFASERLALGRMPLPVGLSLVAVARKTG